jgi:hypothetical protein
MNITLIVAVVSTFAAFCFAGLWWEETGANRERILKWERKIVESGLICLARANGYRLIKASAFEVGLVKDGVGIRTWFASTFDGKMPPLSHPEVLKCMPEVTGWRDS